MAPRDRTQPWAIDLVFGRRRSKRARAGPYDGEFGPSARAARPTSPTRRYSTSSVKCKAPNRLASDRFKLASYRQLFSGANGSTRPLDLRFSRDSLGLPSDRKPSVPVRCRILLRALAFKGGLDGVGSEASSTGQILSQSLVPLLSQKTGVPEPLRLCKC